jgi:hypothetical protein
VLVARAESGTCIRNGQTIIVLVGIGRYRGRPVEFVIEMLESSTDVYEIVITDTAGAIVYQSAGYVTSGDIAVIRL